MTIQNFAPLIPLLLVFGFLVFRAVKFQRVKGQMKELIDGGAIIVDVRNPDEFARGANPLSINIPLANLAQKTKGIDRSKVMVVCCASGTRSGMAVGVLKDCGFSKVINAGPWTNTMKS